MQDEHHAVAALLEQIRDASDQLTAPDWACATYHAMIAELGQLETDTFTHVHLENHVLLPRFVKASPHAD